MSTSSIALVNPRSLTTMGDSVFFAASTLDSTLQVSSRELYRAQQRIGHRRREHSLTGTDDLGAGVDRIELTDTDGISRSPTCALGPTPSRRRSRRGTSRASKWSARSAE